MTKEFYFKCEKYFWWFFILLPFVAGLVRYNWLAVEPYVSQVPQSTSSNSLTPAPTRNEPETPVLRKLKGQAEPTDKNDFIHNRFWEVLQFGALSFLYGLVGCAFYSYGQVIKGRAPNFFTSIGKSIIVAFLFSIFFVMSTL
jgi:hypothetical protein